MGNTFLPFLPVPPMSPLDRIALLLENGTHAIAQVALQFHGAVEDGAAGAAGAFELLRQFFQERGVPRQAVDDGDGLAAATFLFHTQLRDNLQRDRLIELLAALTVVLGPTAVGTHGADAAGVDEASFLGHA